MKKRKHCLEDIWLKVDKKGEDDCWPYLGFKGHRAYGQFSIMGRNYYAHVAAFMAAKGAVTNGKIVMHICNNPSCCNPKHLEEGTYSENQQHAIRSGSHAAGVSTVVRVRYDASRQRWISSGRFQSKRINFYQGRDFFEACCRRKSWEIEQGVSK